jgi:hypothetical protein
VNRTSLITCHIVDKLSCLLNKQIVVSYASSCRWRERLNHAGVANASTSDHALRRSE